MSASAEVLVFELAVVQREYSTERRPAAPRRPRRLRDPIFGDALRAQERLHAAQRDLEDALLRINEQHGQSVRVIAVNTDEKKSRVHELIVAARERRERRRRRPPLTTPRPATDFDDFDF